MLLAAGGAPWESRLLPLLAVPASPVVLARRCVDVPDLVAAAAAGQGSVAAVAADLAGLDADVVARLAEAGVAVVAVAAEGSAPTGCGCSASTRCSTPSRSLADPAVVVSVAAAVGDGARRPVADTGIRETTAAPGSAEPPDEGRLVAVWGPTGAPGRSTVALGLAAAAAADGTETVLVDADVYGGATAQMLAVLDEVSGVLAAARAASTGALDVAGLAESARQVAPRLRVLTGLPRADRWTALRPAALRGVLARAQAGGPAGRGRLRLLPRAGRGAVLRHRRPAPQRGDGHRARGRRPGGGRRQRRPAGAGAAGPGPARPARGAAGRAGAAGGQPGTRRARLVPRRRVPHAAAGDRRGAAGVPAARPAGGRRVLDQRPDPAGGGAPVGAGPGDGRAGRRGQRGARPAERSRPTWQARRRARLRR